MIVTENVKQDGKEAYVIKVKLGVILILNVFHTCIITTQVS